MGEAPNIQVSGESTGRGYVAGADVNSTVPHSIGNPTVVTRAHTQSQPLWESFVPTWARGNSQMSPASWMEAFVAEATQVLMHLASVANSMSLPHISARINEFLGRSRSEGNGPKMGEGSTGLRMGAAVDSFSPNEGHAHDDTDGSGISAHVKAEVHRIAHHISSGGHTASRAAVERDTRDFIANDFGGRSLRANEAEQTQTQSNSQNGSLSGQNSVGLEGQNSTKGTAHSFKATQFAGGWGRG